MITFEKCKVWIENPKARIPEIVIYSEDNFQSEIFRTNCNLKYIGETLNEIKENIKSIVVVSGVWELFEHAEYNRRNGNFFELSEGYYVLADIKSILNYTKIASFRCIKP